MSTTRTQVSNPVSVAPRMTTITARWRVSRAALTRAQPGAVAPGRAHEHALLEIVLEGNGSDWAASTCLVDPRLKTAHPIQTAFGEVRVLHEGEHTHVEAEGLLSATFRGDPASPVFVRTPVLASIGVPGGRYELDSASIA